MLRKRGYRMLMAAAAVMLLAGTAGFCFAAYSGITGLKNTFSTGGVNIGVEEYTMTGSGEMVCKPVTKVRFGSEVSYIPRVTSYAEACYVRVGLSADTGAGKIDILKNCTGIKDGWIKKGDFIYYRYPLAENCSADLCEGFRVPEDWDYKKSNDMTVSICAEAVQARNFMPDFSSEDPWGDVEVKKSYITAYKTVREVSQRSGDGVNIVFDKSAYGITADRKIMFDDVHLMPGDSCSDSIRICNTSTERVEVLFRAVCHDTVLADDINLIIDNGSVFYKGLLSGKALKQYNTIASVGPGDTKELRFDMEIPRDKDNDAQLKKGQATWYFAVKQDEGSSVSTGDSRRILVFALICLAAFAAALFVIRKGRHEERL